jgi:AraC family transcriptional regulator
VTSADVNGLTISELGFPARYVQQPYEPEASYVAIVLEGAMEKAFGLRTLMFGPGSALTMVAGTRHGARFGPTGARILIVKPRSERMLARVTELRGRGFGWLARRLAAELRASDQAAPLAAEGLALQLLAAATRDVSAESGSSRRPDWLAIAEEILRERLGDCVRLSELAAEVGVHPAHLAREFRAHYGESVGEYGRRLRISWAAAELAAGKLSLAEIAVAAGFADQSHFTRLFWRYVGTTPARYRDATHVPA